MKQKNNSGWETVIGGAVGVFLLGLVSDIGTILNKADAQKQADQIFAKERQSAKEIVIAADTTARADSIKAAGAKTVITVAPVVTASEATEKKIDAPKKQKKKKIPTQSQQLTLAFDSTDSVQTDVDPLSLLTEEQRAEYLEFQRESEENMKLDPSLETMYSDSLFFDFNSIALSVSSEAKLDSVVSHIKKSKPDAILLNGYTCPIGNEEYNMHLSGNRADQVEYRLAEKLEKAGLSNPYTISLGNGEVQNQKNAALHKSRLVTIELKYQR